MANQRIPMTFEELTRRIQVANVAIQDIPPQVRPLFLAHQFSYIKNTPCTCGNPDCMSPVLNELLESAERFESFCRTFGKFPLVSGGSVVHPGKS